jgi:transposase
MPAQIEVKLSAKEKQRLQQAVNSRTSSQRLITRSQVVLMASEQMTNGMIAEKLSINKATAGLWRNRYVEEGFEGLLKDRTRGCNHGGKDSEEQEKLRQLIIQKTTTENPTGQTHWSTRTMAKEMGTTHSFVNRVWRQAGLKPHLHRTFKLSNDPQFEEKLADVVGLYMDPPDNAVVLSVDEKSSIQALDRTQPGLPMKPGRCETFTHDYKRHGTSTLFAALNVATGEVFGECKARHRHQEFLDFLKKVDKQTDPDLALHVIVDNYATHKHESVKRWLKRHPRVQLHFIPTSSSWLNMVERFFGLITEKAIRRGVFSSVKDLETAIHAFIAQHNESPKPFTWTKSVETILEKVGRARQNLPYTSTV